MNKTVIIAVVVIIIAGIGYYFYTSSMATPAPADQTVSQTPADTTPAPSATTTTPTPANVTVTYSASGFSPASVSIKQGDSVTFVNQSGAKMWVASDPHPTHEGYSGTTRTQHCPDTAGTAFDECAAGTSYTFTFGKTGSWGYHNHAKSGDMGTVIVQ